MDTTLYLTRHGQTEWNLVKKMQGHMDSRLTQSGVQQAEWLGERLSSVSFDAIYCSSSPRAITTAGMISGNRSTEIVKLDSLKEINMGLWEGQHIEQITQDFPIPFDQFFNEPHLYQPTGQGESYSELIERVLPAIQDILTKHKGHQVLIVTHRITLKAIMSYFMNKQLHEIGIMPDIHPTALCKVTIHNDVLNVDLYGDTAHYR
ncbi:histidine phosphatase family protein [Paenibacillus macquariensis]|uniref:Phosphoglycerate mutase n=1 Tax=Paenibacillus macquariensis TaxID=948756 RepID=A0ABY1JUH4_9BACL|nr:histidine phosphatase family protein [Paenibacillus macquariensis]MEC0090972.1 histidine phosphatase family protein [Paenibacillus macquariensis]OAB34694.1 phosphoglycerate mutase [Paenibacillus macquariensis subsp. macquariensis]SIQ79586.1 phosphoglycerate mutase [Paenibacillus macquariensis]